MKDERCFLYGIVLGFALAMFMVYMIKLYKNEPKAIDVYRNKTTLQVTYQDTIAIDSIVIFKYKD